jgi:hypothetical protein
MPLAHILAPQIMARAREIEAELGPPPALNARGGYLQVTPPPDASGGARSWEPHASQTPIAPSQPYERAPTYAGGRPGATAYLAQTGEKTPYDPRGLVDKKAKEGAFDPRTAGGSTLAMLGALQRSGDPRLKEVADAFQAGLQGKIDTKGTARGYLAPQLIPNANVGARGDQIGLDERGQPIYQAATKPMPASKTQKKAMQLQKGMPVGANERGESVDAKGKPTGYLGDSNAMRRKPSISSKHGLINPDRFAVDYVQRTYGPHLKAMQGNTAADGSPTDKFPAGYFNGMTPEQRKEIEVGVNALRMLERGEGA